MARGPWLVLRVDCQVVWSCSQPLCPAHCLTAFPAGTLQAGPGEQAGLESNLWRSSARSSVGAKLFIRSCFLDLPFSFSPLSLPENKRPSGISHLLRSQGWPALGSTGLGEACGPTGPTERRAGRLLPNRSENGRNSLFHKALAVLDL